MARSGRSRKDASRTAVAIKAMESYGFGEEEIREALENLSKEYGNDGYSFIEGDSYQVLVDAICIAQEKKRQEDINHAEEETLVTHDSVEDKVDDQVVVSADSETPNSPVQSEKDQEELIHIPIPSGGSPPPPPPVIAATSPPPPPRRRRPCYGWISDDDEDGEEEPEFVLLKPMDSNCFSRPEGN